MPFGNTMNAVSIIGVGLYTVCAAVYATAGWTAPPCLAAVVVSGAALLLGGLTDRHAHNQGHARPGTVRPGRDLASDDVKTVSAIHRVHDNGWLEPYHGRMAELWATNETYTFANLHTGYVHNAAIINNKMVVRSDVKQVPHTLGRQTRNRHRNAEIPMLGRPESFLPPIKKTKNSKRFSKRAVSSSKLTSSEFSEEVSSYFFSGYDTHAYKYTDALGSYVGQQIANEAYQLGTWCMTVSTSSSTEGTPFQSPYAILNIGIAVEGPEHSQPIQPACAA